MHSQILKELQEIKRLLALKKEILSLSEFCSYANISKSNAYHLTSTGKIRFYRPFGKMIYITLEDAINFLKQNPCSGTKINQSSVNKYFLNNLNVKK